jgi:dTDP-4-dehydrorhamnose 3,5-epimerase
MPFEFEKTALEDVIVVKAKKIEDSRGFFAELYKDEDFEKAGIKFSVRQTNLSKSQKGVLRGLHFQLNPFAQAKIVRVISGEVFDVAVDLRKSSKTFGRWAGVNLTGEGFNMFYIPEGFAHGFEVLSETAEFEYLCSQVYAPKYERGLLYNDPSLNIGWTTKNPIVSERDLKFPAFSKEEQYF